VRHAVGTEPVTRALYLADSRSYIVQNRSLIERRIQREGSVS